MTAERPAPAGSSSQGPSGDAGDEAREHALENALENALEQALVRLIADREARPDRAPDRSLKEELARLEPELREPLRRRWQTLLRVEPALGAPAAAPPTIPGYRIEAELGRGALGVVYAATDLTLQREVALKVLRSPVQQVIEEARRVASLRHPAVVTVYSVAEGEGLSAIVMERVQGRPLNRLQDPGSWRQRARLLLATAQGVAAAHAAGIVHRDLKPENVLVEADGAPRVLDFGLAHQGSADAEGAFRGTPAYASPEQAAGGTVGAPSDVFSFGVMMFELLTGRRPFEAGTVSELLHAIQHDDPPFPRQLDRQVPEGLQAICLACLARDPARRPSMQRIGDDLARWLAGDRVRLRPALYGDVMGAQLLRQMADVIDWQKQGMVSASEGDSLRSVLRRILADEDHWILDARRLSFPQVLVNAGAWLVVVALALVVWLGQEQLGQAARWAIPAAGTGLLLGAGLWFQSRREVETAAPFLAAAVLSAVPTALSLQVQWGWLSQAGEATAVLGEAYTNRQLLAASLGAGLLSIFSLSSLRFTALAWTTAALAIASWLAWRCVHGWLDLEPHRQALWCLPLCALSLPALWFEHRGRVRWATPFHLGALAALVASVDVIALDAPTWSLVAGLPDQIEPRPQQWSLAANGAFFLLCTLVLERCASLDLRRGARAFELLVPLHLLGALLLCAYQVGQWLDLWIYVGAVLAVLFSGAFREHRRLLYGGLLGLAFASHLPIALDLVEAVPYLLWLAAAGVALAFGTRAWIGR